MAKIQFNDVKAGIKQGTTWGTAADLTSSAGLIHFDSLTVSNTSEYIPIRTTSNSPADILRGAVSANVTLVAKLGFNSLMFQGLAAIFGTSAAPTEVTGGQSDYLHLLKAANSVLGKYLTIAALKESDQVIEIPSFKPISAVIRFDVNQVPVLTISGIADRVIDSAVSAVSNTAAEVSALTLPTVKGAIEAFTGTNMYVRLDDYSVSTALSSADDQLISSLEFTFTRDGDAVRTTRAANTRYVIEPHQLGLTTCQVALQYEAIDDSEQNPNSHVENETTKMMELFYDGDQIGSGTNYSAKLAIASMKAVSQADFVAAEGQRLKDGITYRAVVPAAAAAGMSGNTDLCQLSLTNTRSSALLA